LLAGKPRGRQKQQEDKCCQESFHRLLLFEALIGPSSRRMPGPEGSCFRFEN
jgi:hypothetical protein